MMWADKSDIAFVKEEPRTNSLVTDWPFANLTDVTRRVKVPTPNLAHRVAVAQESTLAFRFQTLCLHFLFELS